MDPVSTKQPLEEDIDDLYKDKFMIRKYSEDEIEDDYDFTTVNPKEFFNMKKQKKRRFFLIFTKES